MAKETKTPEAVLADWLSVRADMVAQIADLKQQELTLRVNGDPKKVSEELSQIVAKLQALEFSLRPVDKRITEAKQQLGDEQQREFEKTTKRIRAEERKWLDQYIAWVKDGYALLEKLGKVHGRLETAAEKAELPYEIWQLAAMPGVGPHPQIVAGLRAQHEDWEVWEPEVLEIKREAPTQENLQAKFGAIAALWREWGTEEILGRREAMKKRQAAALHKTISDLKAQGLRVGILDMRLVHEIKCYAEGKVDEVHDYEAVRDGQVDGATSSDISG